MILQKHVDIAVITYKGYFFLLQWKFHCLINIKAKKSSENKNHLGLLSVHAALRDESVIFNRSYCGDSSRGKAL